jgi:hypothetical protein
MSADRSVQSAAPDELAVRLARLGLPARGVQDRQADPTSGQPITVTIDAEGWHWQPTTEAARHIFGGLLHQEPGHSPAGSPAT